MARIIVHLHKARDGLPSGIRDPLSSAITLLEQLKSAPDPNRAMVRTKIQGAQRYLQSALSALREAEANNPD